MASQDYHGGDNIENTAFFFFFSPAGSFASVLVCSSYSLYSAALSAVSRMAFFFVDVARREGSPRRTGSRQRSGMIAEPTFSFELLALPRHRSPRSASFEEVSVSSVSATSSLIP